MIGCFVNVRHYSQATRYRRKFSEVAISRSKIELLRKTLARDGGGNGYWFFKAGNLSLTGCRRQRALSSCQIEGNRVRAQQVGASIRTE